MKTDTKLNIQLHVEGYASDIFKDLDKPELKNQYESFRENNSPLFEDEPDWRTGAIPITSMPMLIQTIVALTKQENLAARRRKLCLYISGENKEKTMSYTAWIGDDQPSYGTGGQIEIKESALADDIRKAAKDAHKILGQVLNLKINEL